jgi:acetyl-CoA acetyltransferase
MAMLQAGFPYDTCLSAVNRFCSSGLQAVANVASEIRSGIIDIGIGAGVEVMSYDSERALAPPADWVDKKVNKGAKDVVIDCMLVGCLDGFDRHLHRH